MSGGESQRIRLASQIGSGLTGVLYVLDEPSIGLHQKDNQQLIETLFRLRDLGNTVIVVEHDEDAIRQSDHIIDIGVKAGVNGGHIIAEGGLKKILKNILFNLSVIIINIVVVLYFSNITLNLSWILFEIKLKLSKIIILKSL